MSWLRKGKSPEDRFADEVSAMARSLLGARVRRLPDFALEIDRGGTGPTTMFLQNIYREAADLEGEDRRSRLRTAVLAMADPSRPTSWDEAAPALLPAVRSVSWAAAGGVHDIVRRPLVPLVNLLCAIDSEHAMSFATASDLEMWGVTEAEALERAARNLAGQQVEIEMGDGVAFVLGPDGYASSWLAVPQLLRQVAAHLGGTVVAVAASRDSLVLVDVDRLGTSTELLRRTLAEYQEAARQVSPLPYLFDGEQLREWIPPAGHPAAAVVARARQIMARDEYGAQTAQLEELFQRAGEDAFVASCTLMQGPGESLWSWTTWVRQVDNGLLPRADYLILQDNDVDGDIVAVPWEDALRIAGDALERTGYDPPRWRHHGWPDERTVAALRAAATHPPAAQ
jgi:uncharacterized protein YtpQ (UPF0354 family)